MKNEWHGKNTDEARRTGKNLFGHLEITQQACERRNETQEYVCLKIQHNTNHRGKGNIILLQHAATPKREPNGINRITTQ